MRVFGAGLSKTGTSSLRTALQMLGYRPVIHYDAFRLNDIILDGNPVQDFRRYDNIAGVTDVPTAFFWRQVLDAYPDCKTILTVRDIDEWYESIVAHFARYPEDFWEKTDIHSQLIKKVRQMVWGSHEPNEVIYKTRFERHNEVVQSGVDDLLVMDISAGDGWEVLCEYLDCPIPKKKFPHENKMHDKRAYLEDD